MSVNGLKPALVLITLHGLILSNVDQRQGIGDWELDTLIAKGHRQAIVSLTERKSSYTLMRKVISC